MSDLDESLARIRAFKSSKIPLQQKQSALLDAVEGALKEDGVALTPAAYFAALVSLLDRSEVPVAAVYLLSLVVPHISKALLVSKLDVLVNRVAALLTDPGSEVAVVRAGIAVLEVTLASQSSAAWHIPLGELGPLRTLSGVLALAEDSRPKIRKRAVEAVAAVLDSLPAEGLDSHPAVILSADTSLNTAYAAAKDDPSSAARALHLLRAVAAVQWPSRRLGKLCSVLLEVARASDQYVVTAAFEVFDSLFHSIGTESSLLTVISAILDLAPSKTDKQLAPAWLAAVAQAFAAYAQINAVAALKDLPPLVEKLIQYFSAPSSDIVESAGQCMVAVLTEVLAPETVLAKDAAPVLDILAGQLYQLLHAQYQAAWLPICAVYVAFLDQARWLAPVDDSLRVIGVLRSDERLSRGRAATDEVIGAAIRALGPEKVIELIPLQLNIKTDGASGRAWMLPLLRDNIQGATIAHFKDYFIPLSEELDRSAKAIKNEKSSKIVSTVNDQIWSLLPRYFDLPRDVTESLDKDLVQSLLSTLYEKVEYRPLVTNAFKLLVESHLAVAKGLIEDPLLLSRFSAKQSQKALKYVGHKYGSDILKALLNVVNESSPQGRGSMFEAINSILAVIEPTAVEEMFNQVSAVLADSLGSNNTELTLTMLDVISSLAGYLGPQSQGAFFNIVKLLAPQQNSPLVQKKIYQAFVHFVESESGQGALEAGIEEIEAFMLELAPSVQVPARRPRLQALQRVVEALPDNHLHFIPGIMSEVILATKDVNEKSRNSSFQLLASMGRRILAGGVMDHSKMQEFEDDEQTEASISEYFTMILAGLLGSTPYMISATITAVSYAFYEFKDELPLVSALEVVDTVWTFLTSQNREIVKSVLGFVKVSILVLPSAELESHLDELLRNLLGWSTEHKQHFKSKVRHIVERLLRRYGYDTLARHFPQEDIKLLQNIHKSKERSKRKGTDSAASSGFKERQFEDELDEVLYGSSEDSEDESNAKSSTRNAKVAIKDHNATGRQSRQGRPEQYIITGKEPLDLLDQSALTQISSTRPHTVNAKKELKHRLNNKDGRLVIQEEADSDDANLEGQSGISLYVDAVKSGPVRTQKGKLKYKRGKRAGQESDDEEGGDVPSRPQKRRVIQKAKFPRRRNL